MGFFEKNLGIGPKWGLAKNKHDKTIQQHIYDNLENIIYFYKKLRTFYQKDINITNWDGKWQKNVNDLYKKYGINLEYVESKNWKHRIKLEVFIDRLPETPTIFDIKYLFKESLQGELEWVCHFSIEGESIRTKLKTYYQTVMEYSEDYYKEYFKDDDK